MELKYPFSSVFIFKLVKEFFGFYYIVWDLTVACE